MNLKLLDRNSVHLYREEIYQLLEQNHLPVNDIRDDFPVIFFTALIDNQVGGCAAVEVYGDSGLLRSVAVSPGYRGHGIATQLVDAVEKAAQQKGITTLYLLTETAQHYFDRRGYRVSERADAPAGIQSSSEFRQLCPASAVCMRKFL